MVSEAVPPKYLKAGEEYLVALESLGLHPEFLGWGKDLTTSDWNLVLLTSVMEIGGPLTLNKLLFRAYNLGATPKEISPFIVRVFGANTLYAQPLRQFADFLRGDRKAEARDAVTKRLVSRFEIGSMGQDIDGVHIETRDAYVIRPRKRGYEQRTKEWMKFKRNVERLAA